MFFYQARINEHLQSGEYVVHLFTDDPEYRECMKDKFHEAWAGELLFFLAQQSTRKNWLSFARALKEPNLKDAQTHQMPSQSSCA